MSERWRCFYRNAYQSPLNTHLVCYPEYPLYIPSSRNQFDLFQLLLMVKPNSSLTQCVNHGVCTSEVTGSVKYQQYIWYCDEEECKVHACVACSISCHSTCTKGYFYQDVIACACGYILSLSMFYDYFIYYF